MTSLRLVHLSLFATLVITFASAGNSTYLGCFNKGNPDELAFYPYYTPYRNSISMCTDTCAFLNYTIAGLSSGNQCYCGNTYTNYIATNESSCSSGCTGNSQEMCGGASSYSVYRMNLTGIVTANMVPGNHTYRGCYYKWNPASQSTLDLPFSAYMSNSYNSIFMCTWMCARFNYSFAGLGGTDCLCGNSFGNYGAALSDGNCSAPCYMGMGTCGSTFGPFYNSVYETNRQSNGSWSPWSSWNACNATCGMGAQQRTRTCSNPSPSSGGMDCPGVINGSSEQRSCNSTPCAVPLSSKNDSLYWIGQGLLCSRLLNHAIDIEKTSSVISCALLCLRKAACVSFNFAASQFDNNCELNNQTNGHAEILSADAQWHYYYRK